jgi:hypothetical protein
VLLHWCDTQQDLYAVVFEQQGMQSCSGRLTGIEHGIATMSDSFLLVRIPFATAVHCDITTHEDEPKSVTLTWADGKSAFIVTRVHPAG